MYQAAGGSSEHSARPGLWRFRAAMGRISNGTPCDNSEMGEVAAAGMVLPTLAGVLPPAPAPAARAAGRAVVAGLHSCPLLLSGMAWHWARACGGAGRRCWPGWPVVANMPGVTAGAGAYCQGLALGGPGQARYLLPRLRPLLTVVAHWMLIGNREGR